MGYFRENYEISSIESYGSEDFDYLFFGLMILLSPVGIPVYYLGVIGHWVMKDE